MITDEPTARQFCANFVDDDGMARLERLQHLLGEENSRQNLVSAASLEQVWLRHFADSLQLLAHVPRETAPILDLGSGAGFPGLALAIALPHTEVVLIESRKRRTEWLNFATERLELTSCKVVTARLEALDTRAAGVIVARAFAPLSKLLRLSARFSTPSTVWLLPKGRSAAQELAEQPEAVARMFHVERSVTDSEGGILIGQGVPAIT